MPNVNGVNLTSNALGKSTAPDEGRDLIEEPPPTDDTGVVYAPPPPDDRETAGKNRLKSFTSGIVFPPSLRQERAFFRLEIYREIRDNVSTSTTKENIVTIGLPVPVNLTEQFQMNYNSIEIGAFLGNDKIRQAAADVAKGLSNSGAADKGKLTESVSTAVEEVKKSAIPYAVRTVAKSIDAGLGAIVDQMNGGIPNPNLALLYQGHGFRSFQFNWRLIPRNAAESAQLATLIKAIKFSMHPGRKNVFLTFPFKVNPSIWINNSPDLFPMKPSVITSFSVNYAPSSIPAFYKNNAAPSPVEVDISMALQETEIFLQGDFA